MRIPVLAYHAVNVNGADYSSNDHVAFARDLRLIDDLGLRVIPAHWLVEQLLEPGKRELDGCVALTCDDGSHFDYFDLDHPEHGPQRSLANCLTDFIYERGAHAQPDLHLTAFVIASPDARGHVDRNCLIGRGWMSENWWQPAQRSGRISIENHSWDHNHDAIPLPGIGGMQRGSFHPVDNHERADAEIAAATRYLNEKIAPRRTRLFCYPYGQSNAYLRQEYFPRHAHEHEMQAAFGDGGQPVVPETDRWNIPRYVCGWHWKSARELEGILREASAPGDAAA